MTQDETFEKLHAVLEAAASKTRTRPSNEQLIGNFYGACMNERAIDAAGTKPLMTVARIDAVHDARTVQRQIVELGRYGIYAPVRVTAQQDARSPLDVIADVDVAGLGLSDRDYYLRDEPRFKTDRDHYEHHVAKTFILVGYTEAAAHAAAAAVMRLETKLAVARLSRVPNCATRRRPTTL